MKFSSVIFIAILIACIAGAIFVAQIDVTEPQAKTVKIIPYQ